jgi:hypothetical protein
MGQLASVCRSGTGGIIRALRTRRIVDALTPVAELDQPVRSPA